MQETNSNHIALEDARNTVAIFSITMAFSIAIVYYVARIGFDNPILPIIKTLLLSSFLLLLPQGYRFFRAKLPLNIQPSWFNCDAAISLWGFIVLIILGILASSLNLNLFIFIAVIGFLLLIITYINFWQAGTTRQNLRFILVTILFSLFMANRIYSIGYLSPLFTENLIMESVIQKNVHVDELFHSAISNMIKTYGIPSTGIDGLVYIPYHYGSHWLFAHLSSLLNMETLIFYQLGYPVIIISFFFQRILTFSLDFKERFINDSILPLRTNWLLWVIFFITFIGFYPKLLFLPTGVGSFAPVNSESHGTGFTMAFMTLSFALQINLKSLYNQSISWIESLLPILIIPLLISTVAIFKISLGVLLFCAAVYVFIRFKLYQNKIYIASLLTLLLTFTTAFLLAKNPSPSPLRLFAYIKYYVQEPWKQFWFHLVFSWSWIYIVFILKINKIKKVKDFLTAIKQLKLLDIEIILLFSILGVLPGMILKIGGGSAYYFVDFQMGFSISLLIAYLSTRKIII